MMFRFPPFVVFLLILCFTALSMTLYSQEKDEKIDYSRISPLRNLNPEAEGTYEDYIERNPPVKYSVQVMDRGIKPFGSGGIKILVMVNSTLRPQIEDRLLRYINDLEVNGYDPILIDVSGGTPQNVKDTIIANSADLAGVVFVGHIAVPWFEMDNDFSGYASFPCDYFYMDLDGTWQDTNGSGKYDYFAAGSGDEDPEIFIGRIDASMMSAGEVTLLRHYFDKLHDFYTGALTGTNFGLTYVDDDWQHSWDINYAIQYAYPDYQNIAGTRTTINTERNDYLFNRLKNPVYEYIQLCCHSYSGGCHFTRGGWLYSTTVIQEMPEALFYNFFNCSGARFTDTNYFGGAHIFNMSTKSLGGVGSTKTGSMLSFQQFYRPLGQEKSHGQAFKEWFDYIAPFSLSERQWHLGMTLIGDPFVSPRRTYELRGLSESVYPKFQRDNRNSGFVPDVPVIHSPGFLWYFSLGTVTGEQKSSPVIAEDGTIYVGSASSTAPGLYAINPDGTLKWFYSCEPVLSTPSIDVKGRIYFATWTGTNTGNKIYCLNDDVTSASIAWQVNTDNGSNVLTSAPLSNTGEYLYGTGVSSGQMIGLNVGNGSLKWKQPSGGGMGGSPALTPYDKIAVFVASESKKVYLLNTSAGIVLDSFETDAYMWAPTPCIGKDGTIYVGDASGKVYAFSIVENTLVLKWSHSIGGAINGGIGAVFQKAGKNRLYAVDNSGGRIVALLDNGNEGAELWSYDIGDGSWTYNAPTVLFDGTIYIGSHTTNTLYALRDMDTHAELRWEFSTGTPGKRLTGKGLAINSNGIIYCSSEDGILYAIHETAVPSLTVLTPNGGNVLLRGSTCKIKWESTGSILNVKIQLYRSGIPVLTINESAPNTGEYDWTIPVTIDVGTEYLIKITQADDENIFDYSDDFFEITLVNLYYVSLDGNDETGTGRADAPWRTIQHAILTAPGGSSSDKTVINIGPGTFIEHFGNNPDSPEGIVFPYEGNLYGWELKNHMRVTGTGFDKTIIMTDAGNQSPDGNASVIHLNGWGNEIQNLTVRHGIPQGAGSGIRTTGGRCRNNLIKNIRIDNPGYIGILAENLNSAMNDSLHVQYVLINKATYAGLFVSGSANACIPHHLTIVDGKKEGGTGNAIVAACKIDVSFSILANNLSALKTIGTGVINSAENRFWQNTSNYDEEQPGSIPVRLNDSNVDPRFFIPHGLKYYSFRLKDGSPAYGRGFIPATIVDTDGDGIPDFWEEFCGLDPLSPHDALLDSDGDGKTNLQEYFAETDPLDPDSFFRFTDARWDADMNAPVIEWSSEAGMTYAILAYSGAFGDNLAWVPQSISILQTDSSLMSWVDINFNPQSQRYYQVWVMGRGNMDITKDTIGAMKIETGIGRTLISNPFIYFDDSLDTVIGSQLTGDNSPLFADSIETWDKETLDYLRAYFNTNEGVWKDSETDGKPRFGFTNDTGYWLNIPAFNPARTIWLVGKVPAEDREIEVTVGRNLVGRSFPVGVSLDNSNLIESGFTGNQVYFFSDSIEWWDRVSQNYFAVYYDNSDGRWKNSDGTITTRNINSGEGFWMIVPVFNTGFTWSIPKPYNSPPN